MRRVDPKTLLFALILAVPVVVGGAGLASFLLLRAGFGPLVWAGLPLLALILIVVLLGLVLGYAAGGSLPGRPREGERRREDPKARSGPPGPGRGV